MHSSPAEAVRHTVMNGDTVLSVVDCWPASGAFDQPRAGSPIVILHGLAGSSTEFLPAVAALGGHRVLLLDARGHGRSSRHPIDVSREAHVSDVVAVIERLVGEPVILVGQSMGGHTAMLVAARRPDLVDRLVLLEAGVGGDGNERSRSQMHEYFLSWPVPFRDEAAARAFLGDAPLGRAWADSLERLPDGLWPRFDSDVMVRTIAAVDEVARWDEWEQVTAPTLAVFAQNGMFGESMRDELVRRRATVSRVDIPGGHDAHLDSPEQWKHVLTSFVAH